MLKALARYILRNEAKPTPRRHEERSLTRSDVTEILDEYMKQINYEWNEWYEKFDKLHLRLAKRAAREAGPQGTPPKGPQKGKPNGADHEQVVMPSALHFRRPGSV